MAETSGLKRSLGLFDCVCIIVGMIIGSGIFSVPSLVASHLGSAWWILAAWFLGGLLALAGALCYAELATTYPRAGGDYWYLNKAFGSWCGFLFAWTSLIVIRTGNIAAMAYVFAEYASHLYSFQNDRMLYALFAVLLFTCIHCLGVREGKITQNILTSAKVLGILAVFCVGFMAQRSEPSTEPVIPVTFSSFFLASIYIQFTYGGWNESAYAASEVKNPSKNLLRSLVLGTLLVTVIYCGINAMLLYAVGAQGLAGSDAVFSEILSGVFGSTGARLMSGLVTVSTLGAVSVVLFTSARINYALGSDHKLFSFLSYAHPRTGSPINSLLLLCAISGIIISLGGIETTIEYTAAAQWLFYMMTGLSLFILRRKGALEDDPREDDTPPYRVHFYPVLPIVFISCCAVLLYSALSYAGWGSLIGFALVFSGLPVYWLSKRLG